MSAITEEHRAFAIAVVAAARKHGMNHIDMTFDGSGHANWEVKGLGGRETIKMSWGEGRHGAKTNIVLEYSATQVFKENVEAGDEIG